MVTQLFFPWNDRIDEIVAFMKKWCKACCIWYGIHFRIKG
jgi:hypothetical protein